MKKQAIDNQKGEITFRRKLYQQQVEGRALFDDENDAASIEDILRQRMEATLEQMRALKEMNFPMSPYLELGAERCQRSLVMENDLGVRGGAVDLSFDMLKGGEFYAGVFGKPGLPLRVCCDANNLPFRSNSLPFVFCYEFLHHFPEPYPVMAEIHRVLSPGGYFYFDEEPYRRLMKLPLYSRKKSYEGRSGKVNLARKVADFLFCEEVCNETEHGVIENLTIPLRAWHRAFDLFAEKRVELKSVRGIASPLYDPPSRVNYLLACLFGGSVTALCRKGGAPAEFAASVADSLVCPSCRAAGGDAPLTGNDGLFRCAACGTPYPSVDGVLFLLSHDTLRELYPEVSVLLPGR